MINLVKKKNSYYKILALTANAQWVNNPKIVHEVQELGRGISKECPSRISFKGSKRVVVTDAEKNIRYYNTIEDCTIMEHLARKTIAKHIKNKRSTKDGRTFILLDNYI